MNIEAAKDLSHSYLILSPDHDIMGKFELSMLEENRIYGILPMEVTDNDGIIKLFYDITGKQPLTSLLEELKLESTSIRHIMFDIRKILSETERFLLKADDLFFDTRYIYADPDTLRLWFLYIPDNTGDMVRGFHELLESMLKRVDRDDSEGVVLAYRLYRESSTGFTGMDHMKQLLLSMDTLEEKTKSEVCRNIEKTVSGMDEREEDEMEPEKQLLLSARSAKAKREKVTAPTDKKIISYKVRKEKSILARIKSSFSKNSDSDKETEEKNYNEQEEWTKLFEE